MMDRLLEGLVRFSVIGLITLAAFGCLVFAYLGFFQLLSGEAFGAAQSMGLGGWMGIGVYFLVRHRNDLMYC